MTTAHRPTFDPARGKEAQRGVAYHQRLLPAHTQLKVRKPGQGGDADSEVRDLRAELLAAEAAHFAKRNGTSGGEATTAQPKAAKRALGDAPPGLEGSEAEEPEAKRRRVLEETRDIDADSDGTDSDSSDEDSDDEEDETAELMRELEKIKRERAEQKAKEDAVKAAQDQEQREEDIALGNPLLNPQAFNVKRRWDDDVIFKNQARGTEQKGKKEFVNDLLRSDFHKKFMSNMSSDRGTRTASEQRIPDVSATCLLLNVDTLMRRHSESLRERQHRHVLDIGSMNHFTSQDPLPDLSNLSIIVSQTHGESQMRFHPFSNNINVAKPQKLALGYVDIAFSQVTFGNVAYPLNQRTQITRFGAVARTNPVQCVISS